MQLSVNINWCDTVGAPFWEGCAFAVHEVAGDGHTALACYIWQSSGPSLRVLPRATGLFAPAALGPWKLGNRSTQNVKGWGVSSSKHKGVVRALCCLCSVFPFKGLAHWVGETTGRGGGEAVVRGTFLFLTVLLKAWDLETHYRIVQQEFLKDSSALAFTHEALNGMWTTHKSAAGSGNPMNSTLTTGHFLLLFSSPQYLYAYRCYCDTIFKQHFGCALDGTILS